MAAFPLKEWAPYINNSRNLAGKYARIPRTLSVPRSEHCDLRGTDYVQGQIFEHIFATNGVYCFYYPSIFFFTTYAVLKYSTSLAGECSVTRASFDQSRASENVSRILSKVLP